MVNAQACARNYTVQPGDVCNKISAAQNVSTYVYNLSISYLKKKDFVSLCRYQLATVNKAIDPACDNLRVGEVSSVQKKKQHFYFVVLNYKISFSSSLGTLPWSCW